MTRLLDAGVLYVVATPIGHLGDLSRRAEEVLKTVQIVAAEDTRRTRVLLDHIDHHAPELVSLHEHNERGMTQKLIARLKQGDDVALVSDAGTPLVNDPGYLIVQAAHTEGIAAVPIPGACSITAALSVCPLACHPFRYVGFVPAKAGARKRALSEWLNSADALVFLETPHRILATLADLDALTQRQIMVARELTKQYETIEVGRPEEVAQALGANPKGEFTCIIEAAEPRAVSYDRERVLAALLEELPPAKAARIAASICDAKKSELYELALELSERAAKSIL
jgi:16S rRNA (cytidine1402-2'-O)-methyltransferase